MGYVGDSWLAKAGFSPHPCSYDSKFQHFSPALVLSDEGAAYWSGHKWHTHEHISVSFFWYSISIPHSDLFSYTFPQSSQYSSKHQPTAFPYNLLPHSHRFHCITPFPRATGSTYIHCICQYYNAYTEDGQIEWSKLMVPSSLLWNTLQFITNSIHSNGQGNTHFLSSDGITSSCKTALLLQGKYFLTNMFTDIFEFCKESF